MKFDFFIKNWKKIIFLPIPFQSKMLLTGVWNLKPANVWIHKICFIQRTTIPFVFVDRYDPNEACKHTWWVLVTVRKFFIATQVYTSSSPKLSFSEFHLHFSLNLNFSMKVWDFNCLFRNQECLTDGLIVLKRTA